ncbi:hypothetical protein QYM36_013652 [Artemia franciscana]|uniref:Cap-specific mRNA (nucleoside-2'-O-)-methyltransferase 1 n=1 Tax=Artemia franciscana TaxID=6661 RepID=A0AA88KZ21_ARTSF|nr:hypothetical protein QYM36_013652 [Artemia franciscana]
MQTVFDSLDEKQLRDARTRSNPFETIKKVFFQNRAAVKMAEIDAVTEFMFTNFNQRNDDASNVDAKEPLYFADVCAGPGGFSEYVLFRKKWHSKGFGFTLKGDNDFKLEEFLVGPPECFEPYYGKNGDGNVYEPENITSLKDFIYDNTDGRGVHFMMADGGFSVDGQENIQEILSKRLYLCQFLVALCVVRTGGHFVCKLFDIFTPFSVGLIYLMWMSFEQISIFKPNSSRPANSERYIICKGKKEEASAVTNYMAMINSTLAKLTNLDKDVTDIVPLHILTQTSEFFDYIYTSNVELGRRQIIGLAKIAAFARDTMLTESKQADMKKKCLEYWKIEEDVRRRPHKDSPRNTANKLIKMARVEEKMLTSQDKFLDKSNLATTMRSLLDWKGFIVGGCIEKHERTFYLSLGRSEVYRYENGSWVRPFSSEGSCSVELPRETLLYGEIIFEYRGSGKGQRKRQSLYIYDAFYLGGEYIGDKHLVDRYCLCQKFAKAVNKPSRNDLIAVRVHTMYDTEHITLLFKKLNRQYMKGGGPTEKLVYMVDETSCILPRGVLFLKGTKDPWMLGFSKSTQKQYFFHTMKRVSEYNAPKDSCLPFSLCMEKRFLWEWSEESRLLSRQPEEASDEKLSIRNVKTFVHSMSAQSGIACS